MNIVDIIIIFILICGALVGFKRGLIKSVVELFGAVIAIILAFNFKNPVAIFLYEKLPFFNFSGDLAGVTVINILIYEAIAFVAVVTVIGIVIKLLIMFTKIIDWLINSIIVLSFPAKILGMAVGAIQSYILIFCTLFVFTQINLFVPEIKASESSHIILTKTPILSPYVRDIYDAFNEIYELADQYNDTKDKEEFNAKAFDKLLKYDIISVDSADKLIKLKKINIKNAADIVDKYR